MWKSKKWVPCRPKSAHDKVKSSYCSSKWMWGEIRMDVSRNGADISLFWLWSSHPLPEYIATKCSFFFFLLPFWYFFTFCILYWSLEWMWWGVQSGVCWYLPVLAPIPRSTPRIYCKSIKRTKCFHFFMSVIFYIVFCVSFFDFNCYRY